MSDSQEKICSLKKEEKIKDNNNYYLYTNQITNNEEKLLFFISDKKKLNLKSCFDHKGSKDFLYKKNEAMEKIELDETIENSMNVKEKGKKFEEKNNKKLKKKIKKRQSHIVKKNKNLQKLSENEFKIENFDRKNTPDCKKKKIHKSSIHMNRLFFEELKDKIKIEEESCYKNLKVKSSKDISSKIHKSKKNKLKQISKTKNSEDQNISINTITTVDSKLFNNNKDYNNYKSFITKDDLFIEEIVDELKSNNN